MLHDAGDLESLWSGEMRGVVVAGRRVVLVNVGGEVHAYEDRCAHQAVAMSTGTFDGATLTCRSHAWQYDARTGRGVNPAAVQLRAYRVEIRAGRILVDVDGPPLAERRTA